MLLQRTREFQSEFPHWQLKHIPVVSLFAVQFHSTSFSFLISVPSISLSFVFFLPHYLLVPSLTLFIAVLVLPVGKRAQFRSWCTNTTLPSVLRRRFGFISYCFLSCCLLVLYQSIPYPLVDITIIVF
jgi:hypothetical protein